MAVQIDIVANDKATPVINKALATTERKALDVSRVTSSKFRDAGIQIAQRCTGAASSIVGSLGRIPHPAAIAVVAIGAIGSAAFSMAKDFAKATADTNSDSREFLISLDNLEKFTKKITNAIGGFLMPAFSGLLDLVGLGATEIQKVNAAFEAQVTIMRRTNSAVEDFRKNFAEIVNLQTKQSANKEFVAFIDAFAKGNFEAARAIANHGREAKLLQLTEEQINKARTSAIEQDDARLKRQKDEIKNLEKLNRERSQQLFLETIEAQTEENIRIGDVLKRNNELIAQMSENMRKAREEFEGSGVSTAEKEFLKLNQQVDDVDANIQKAFKVQTLNTFVDSLTSVATGAKNAKNALADLLDTTINLLARLAITAGLNALFPGAGALLGFAHGGIIPNDIRKAQTGLIVRRPTMVVP